MKLKVLILINCESSKYIAKLFPSVYLYISSILKASHFSILYILCSSAYERYYGFVTDKTPEQYKNIESVKISTIVFYPDSYDD